VASSLAPGVPVLSVVKGIEAESRARVSEIVAAEAPNRRVAALSGPNLAAEVAAGRPAGAVVASADAALAGDVAALLGTDRFRVYTNPDLVGVELAGALKNVIALAEGILEGLGLGNNPRAALITRGLAEITRLGVALGADPLTFAGLAGMGDLILTATGALSRNRSLGVELGRGMTLAAAQAGRASVAEGVITAKNAVALAERHGVELPIASQVADILFHDKPPRQAVGELMERDLKAEQWR
jgi:glycerol-3-phosphate dehydrogenase (NAD(P)+)